MEKADFYVGLGRNAEWIGSVSKCGEVWEVSPKLLLQVNQTMYEEEVIEYINFCEGVVANHKCQWPWTWVDSRMTDYSYFFLPEMEKVYMSIEGGIILDPVKIIQGEPLTEANAYLGTPHFPLMAETVCFEENKIHGYTPTASL